MAIKWEVAAKTDKGRVRQANEDNFWISPDQRVLVVADGMGGHAAGQLASKLAVQAISSSYEQNVANLHHLDDGAQWLQQAVAAANSDIYNTSIKTPSVRGMGTTIVMALQSPDGYVQFAHAGDSRLYHFSDGQLKMLTRDHSLVQELVHAGHLTQQQAMQSPYRNQITRCLGTNETVKPDINSVDILPGDWLLLCSDGLTGVLGDEDIASTIRKAANPESACGELVEDTLNGGAPDNVTIIISRLFEE